MRELFIAFIMPLIQWIGNNTGKLISVSIVVISGYASTQYAERKDGVVIHTQGDAITAVEGGYRYVNDEGELYGPVFETGRDYAIHIGDVGIHRFGTKYGASYPLVIDKDTIYKLNYYDRVTAQVAGWNSPVIGVMLVRYTDAKDRQKVFENLDVALGDINDTLVARYGHPIQFVLTHKEVDEKKWKSDPHEYIPMMDAAGLHWDDRMIGIRLELPTREESMLKWSKKTRKLLE